MYGRFAMYSRINEWMDYRWRKEDCSWLDEFDIRTVCARFVCSFINIFFVGLFLIKIGILESE